MAGTNLSEAATTAAGYAGYYHDYQLDSEWNLGGYVLLLVAFVLILIFAFLGNTVVLFLFAWDKSLRTPTNSFLMSIMCSDLIMTFTATPLAFSSVIVQKWLFGDHVCQMYGFAVLGLGLVSLLSHGAIAIDRYFVIAKPHLGIKINHRIAGLAILGTWIWAFLWALFPLMGWSGYTYEGLGTWCSVIWHSDSGDRSIIAYVLCLFLFTYIMTLICMAFCYTSIYLSVKRVSMRLKSHSTEDERRNFQRERRVLRVVVMVAVVFFAAWTPYGILGLWAAFGDPRDIPIYLITSGSMCGKASTALNPLVYMATNKSFRRSFQRFLGRFRGEQSDSEQVTENLLLKIRKKAMNPEKGSGGKTCLKVPAERISRSIHDSGNGASVET